MTVAGSSNAAASGLYLPSDLWVDRADARAQLDEMESSGTVDSETAERLLHFVEQGYLVFPIEIDGETLEKTFAELDADIDRLWQERPSSIAYAYDSPAKRTTLADPELERRPRYRVHDLHSWSESALELYLNRSIFRHVELIYREPAVAIQSLYFEFGSQQLLHRDPVVVPTAPASHLLAAWISLEDIDPDCGPLQVVPESHRLPYFEFSPGEFMFDPARMGSREIEAATEWDRSQCAARGLVAKPFLGRKGEVLIWHHSLLHGGARAVDEALTRKSFVIHFSTRARYRERAITLAEPVDPSFPQRASAAPETLPAASKPTVEPTPPWSETVYSTSTLLERRGLAGFDNPLS